MGLIQHYFAYGSNMNPRRVKSRGLRVHDAVGAKLDGFELVFDKLSMAPVGTGHANIRYAPGCFTEGVLYELAHVDEITKMDSFERAPINYSREVVCIRRGSEAVWAWTYVANPAVLKAGLVPSCEYLEHLLAGRPYLSPGYFNALVALRDVCL